MFDRHIAAAKIDFVQAFSATLVIQRYIVVRSIRHRKEVVIACLKVLSLRLLTVTEVIH
jgi:hypothetical protein